MTCEWCVMDKPHIQFIIQKLKLEMYGCDKYTVQVK